MLKQTVISVISKAIQHGNAGGEIRVITRSVPNGVTLEVRDSGPGIAPGDSPHILNAILSSRQVTGAGGRPVGQGLSICKMIVESMAERLK